MKKMLFVLSVLALFLFGNSIFAQEPENLNIAKEQIKKYHDSGEYERDISQVIQNAEKYLAARLQDNHTSPRKIAIVSDIDDTAISGYKHLVERDFGGDYPSIMESLRKGDSTVISETLVLYNFAKQHNVAVFFVSGRPQSMQAITEKNLIADGYKAWDGLFLRPEDYNKTHKTIVPFKVQTRKQLEDQGYDIVLTIGDQDSDISGGYADKTFKLPNPFYYIP